MSASIIFPNLKCPRCVSLLAFWLVACLVPAAHALDPNRSFAEYIHSQWNAQQGFPGGAVHAFAQTPDGYLWIASEKGLVRFDGIGFRLFNHANTASLPASPVLGLIVDSEGSLLIRLQTPGLLRYRNEQFEDVLPATLPDTVVTAMARGLSGDVLLVSRQDPMRYSGGKLIQLTPGGGSIGGIAISVAGSPDGTLWMGTRDRGLFSSRSSGAWASRGLADRKINCLLPGAGSQLWIGTDNGLIQWNGTEMDQAGLPSFLSHTEVFALDRDRDANLWVGTASGLVRVDARRGASVEGTSRPVNALFEDREGNLWVGTARGIERYHDSAFVNYVSASEDQGAARTGPIFVDDTGRTWFGGFDGGLFWVTEKQRGNITTAGLDKDVVYSITGGHGEVWIGRQRGGLTELREEDGSFLSRTYTTADGLLAGSIYAVQRTRDGTVWAGGVNGGVSRLRNGRITTYTTADGLLSNSISAIEEAADGTVWFATSNGLQSFAHDKWEPFLSKDGVPPGRINCLTEDSQGVLWIGTDAGLAFIRAGRFETPSRAPDALQEPVYGIAVNLRNDLWIATSGHVVKVPRARLLGELQDESMVREFGPADGLPETEGVRRSRSVAADPSNRIWFSLNSGVSMLDPARVAINSAPAIVHIESVSADGRTLDGAAISRIPARARRVTVQYIGLSLAAPEGVRYRYRLDGFDNDWSSSTAARETIYTNLKPGSYRFHVIAGNSDGVWSRSEATIGLEIVPAIWQTWWFLSVLALTCIVSLLLMYRLRLRRLTNALNMRFEERLAERNRIAQELHDTLLQGLLSASMQVHVAADALPPESPAKPALTRVIQVLRQVTDEGRTVLRGLRQSDVRATDLADAFSRIRQDLEPGGEQSRLVDFRVIVEGEPRPLHPLLRDEVYRIGREALTNAFRHSRAHSIELALKYDSSHLRVFVRDDGLGIDPKRLQADRSGHRGLSDMRERAERIGSRLHVYSSPSAGTEIELDVPGRIAFEDHQSGGKFKWLRKPGWSKERFANPNRETE